MNEDGKQKIINEYLCGEISPQAFHQSAQAYPELNESIAMYKAIRQIIGQHTINEEEKYLVVSHYLQGEVPQRAFDALMAQHPSLHDELALHHGLDQYLGASASHDYRDHVRRVIDVEKSQSKSGPRWLWYAAASVAVVLGSVLYWAVPYNGPASHAQLFAQYFTPIESVGIARSEGNTHVQEGMRAYEQGEYQKAVALFLKPTDTPKPFYQDFYTGIAYLAMGQPSPALPYLKDYLASENALKYPALWYSALAYLKLGQTGPCQSALGQLIQDNSFYQAQATELRQALPK